MVSIWAYVVNGIVCFVMGIVTGYSLHGILKGGR